MSKTQTKETLNGHVVHRLKTINPFFTDLWKRKKKFEIRKNDRNYRIGDHVYLEEYDSINDKFSGRFICAQITYVLNQKQFSNGLQKGYIIFCFDELGRSDTP